MRNKVVSLIITGGQDNVQAVAGQMLTFFAELGCQFPPFPFIAHSRGWSAEDMENNEQYVRDSKFLHDGATALVRRSADMARVMIEIRPRQGRAGARRPQGPGARYPRPAPGDMIRIHAGDAP